MVHKFFLLSAEIKNVSFTFNTSFNSDDPDNDISEMAVSAFSAKIWEDCELNETEDCSMEISFDSGEMLINDGDPVNPNDELSSVVNNEIVSRIKKYCSENNIIPSSVSYTLDSYTCEESDDDDYYDTFTNSVKKPFRYGFQ